jgi:CRISPR-associated endonuclease Csn1
MIILGLDGGIASIGWALIDDEKHQIIAAGARCFDAPEDKDRVPTNQIRRQKRGVRRLIKRRRSRMVKLRRLFAQHGLIHQSGPNALALGINPWTTRSEGLDRRLTPPELAAALGHIAVHRGSSIKPKRSAGANATDNTNKYRNAIDNTLEILSKYRTAGQMFVQDPKFAKRKRNSDGVYLHLVQRDDLRHEVKTLFDAQRRLGNAAATETLQEAFIETAFHQRPVKGADAQVGVCQFEEAERRTARHAPSFELFRLLSRLNNMELITKGARRPISPAELDLIVNEFGKTKSLTFTHLRTKLLKLHPDTRFSGISPADEKNDVTSRSGACAEGTKTLRDALGNLWRAPGNTPERLDRIAEILTFRDDENDIQGGLKEIGCAPDVTAALMQGLAEGRFAKFKGAARISAQAARNLIPGLQRGLKYSEACDDLGYNHAAQRQVNIADIRNPVARKALAEMMRQVRTIIATHGLPDRIHVELARDVGKSAEEREAIRGGIEKRNKQRDRMRDAFRQELGRDPSDTDLLKFELWKEQNHRCLYTDDCIPAHALISPDNLVQIDHILPWSRFGDDSFLNKTLCFASANQQKRGRTPYEWFSQDKTPEDWTRFERSVEGCKSIRSAKKRGHYLRQNAAEVEQRFFARNLGDTRYATRVLLGLLTRLYPAGGGRHVLARPGALTSKLRRGWGLQGLKKNEKGERIPDDRHHALDAIVLAATTESMVQSLTRAFQEAERQGLARDFAGQDMPERWLGFRQQAEQAVDRVSVSRPERRRVPGKVHDETVKQIRVIDGEGVVFIRKSVDKLTPKDLERIPVPVPYGRIADPAKLHAAMLASIKDWWAVGQPKDSPPRMPNGDVIRKVRVQTQDKVAVQVRGGTADRGDMARVDVFRETNQRGKKRYHLVPIYPHQMAVLDRAPSVAIVAYKNEDEWTYVTNSKFDFLFSLFQNSIIEVQREHAEKITGYFKGVHRGTGAISVASMISASDLTQGIGSKTLLSFQKLQIDRLGNITPAPKEPRTWRGAVCT